MGVDNQVIPTHFLVLMAHLISILMVFYTEDHNILASLPSSYTTTDLDSARVSVNAALGIALGCLAFEFIGFLGGWSMFSTTANSFCSSASAAASSCSCQSSRFFLSLCACVFIMQISSCIFWALCLCAGSSLICGIICGFGTSSASSSMRLLRLLPSFACSFLLFCAASFPPSWSCWFL